MESGSFLQNLSASIQKNGLFGKQDKLLCAVSGGIDSMVLAHSLHSLGYSLEIAHVNYGLRGEDSNLDEKQVQQWAERNKLPFHLKRADAALKEMQGSLQENARNFRYQWLESLAHQRGIKHLLLGHHAGDQVETFLLQLFRGAGVRGLSAMQPSSGMRRRPLLSFSREDLETYARSAGLEWRIDLSNEGDDYRRNQVRHHLLPLLQTIFPGYQEVIQRNARRMQQASQTLDFLYDQLYREFLKEEKPGLSEFHLDAIADHPLSSFFLAELMERKGFHFEDAAAFSDDPRKTESRIRDNGNGLVAEFRFPRLLLRQHLPESLPQIRLEEALSGTFPIIANTLLECAVSDGPAPEDDLMSWSCPTVSLVFPLMFRPWKAGDRMAVKGMAGRRKKISDLLSEARQSPGEKASQYVLEDAAGKILWLPGLRKSESPGSGNIAACLTLRLLQS